MPGKFNCDSCSIRIEPFHPRIHCLSCRDYDLCANCYLGERSNGEHLLNHDTTLLKMSEPVQAAPPPTAPLNNPNAARGPPPSLPPRVPPRSTSSSSANGEGWKPFYDDHMNPTPTLLKIMDAVFAHLDQDNIEYLYPEVYSGWLDDLGYELKSNPWKNNLKQLYGHRSKEAVADMALLNCCQCFGFDHILHQRFVDGPSAMPMFTKRGFIEITTVETLADVNGQFVNIRRALEKYYHQNPGRFSFIREWGEMPRNVLPDVPDPRMLARIESVNVAANAKAEREVAASMAKLKMQQRGQQNALDLIDDSRWVRTYY